MSQRINRYIPGNTYIYICGIDRHVPGSGYVLREGRYFNKGGRRVPKEVPGAKGIKYRHSLKTQSYCLDVSDDLAVLSQGELTVKILW